jgi:hypothetical protein
MKKELKKISQLLNEKKITQDEYNLLTTALNKKNSSFLKIINPYTHFNEKTLLVLGFMSVVAMTLLAPFAKITFSGLLDLQTSKEMLYWESVQRCALQNMVILILWTLGTWLAAFICKQKNLRFVDFFIGSLIPRIPYLIVTLLYLLFFSITGIDPYLKEVTGPIILLIVLLTVPGLILNLVYLFFGLQNASGLQSNKLWVSYISLVFVIETLSVIICRTWIS